MSYNRFRKEEEFLSSPNAILQIHVILAFFKRAGLTFTDVFFLSVFVFSFSGSRFVNLALNYVYCVVYMRDCRREMRMIGHKLLFYFLTFLLPLFCLFFSLFTVLFCLI